MLLQSGNLCLQNSIKVEMLELILKNRSWKNLNNDAARTLLYYTIIEYILYNYIFCYYAIVVALFYIHYYKPMRIAFKNILTTLLIISVH